MLKIWFSFLLFLSSHSLHAEYESPLKWSGNIYKIINQHNRLHKKFSQQVCRPGDEAKYLTLLRQYRGQGFYLPKYEGKIDKPAIMKNLKFLREKVNYIESTKKRLENDGKITSFSLLYKEIDQIILNLLSLKKKYFNSLVKAEKEKLLLESQTELIKLKKQFDIFMDRIYFMKSFNYPNDYLKLRASYEAVKDDEEKKQKANEIFFYRKIVEDGALDPNRTRPDKFVRSTLDNLYQQIQKEKDFISENVRYDLRWIEKNLDRIFRYGYKAHVARLGEWHERTLENYKFYHEIVQKKNAKKAEFLIQKENEATNNLKEFVYKKQAEAYEFWIKQPTINKALYSLETILVNEVGVLDGQFGLERTSVAKVVLNRYHDDFYNQLEDDQPLVKYLNEEIDTDEELWLNILFKIGEFSFTYHYIPAVAKIFCPDMSSRGNSIRKKNLKIALKALKAHDGRFKAMRYFSRVSMFGKIDMSTVWSDYERMPERVGYESLRQRQLVYYYHANKYQFLYDFYDERNLHYTVVRIQDRTYSMRWIKGKPIFYDYRNPHLFTYFTKKDL